ncbi:SPOR domain-containing protein [Roseibium salinum]
MTWPAAARSVPQTEEDETPPPPEGYDLDAVARAMQESDPSLSGAGVLPPHPAAERAAIPHAGQRSRRGVFVAAGVLGVAVLGAGAFLLLDGGSVEVPSGPPPVISGLEDPLKVYPEKTAAANTDSQTAKLIYDRVDGSTGPERLVVPESPEPAELPPAPVEANGDAGLVPGSPRQVRTLVVRPDGTIISGGEQPVPATDTSTAAPLTSPGPSTTEEAPRVVPTTPVVTENAPEEPILPESEATPATSAEAPLEAPEPTVTSTPAIVTQQTAEDAAAASEPQVSEPAAPVPSILPRKKPEAPVQIARAPEQTATPAASAQENAPLNLTQPANAPAETAPAGQASSTGSIPSGTNIVQVTSQRTAQAASDAYSGLQRRFPGILGNREAVIVSADLGDRGTFYRARIPTGSRDEAISLCESLKGAGGDCFVRRQP